MRDRADLSAPYWIVAALALLTVACEVDGSRPFSIIPGPAVPSPFPTASALVWDTREELGVWVNNQVTHGPVPVSLAGDGVDAVIRIEPQSGVDGWVLRGPDLVPPAQAVSSLRIRYRWRPDPALSPPASRTFPLVVRFEALNPPHPPTQPGGSTILAPAPDWTVADFSHGFGASLVVRYVYLFQSSGNRGVFEIDRIELR